MLDLDAEAIYRVLLSRVREVVAGRDVRLVGIHTGGVWIAHRLKEDLAIPHEVGSLDVSFYRDDFASSGLSATVKPSHIPFDVVDQNLLLVDDVLYTGRTIEVPDTISVVLSRDDDLRFHLTLEHKTEDA